MPRDARARAVLLLDAIGYDAAFIGGEDTPIPPGAFRRLRDRVVMPLFLWHAPLSWRGASSFSPSPPGTPRRRRIRPPSASRATPLCRRRRSGYNRPRDVPAGHLRRVDIRWPEWTIAGTRTIALEATEPPEPTISAVLDLVTEEAQFYAQQGERYEPG